MIPNSGKAAADTTELSVKGPNIGKLLDCFFIIFILLNTFN